LTELIVGGEELGAAGERQASLLNVRPRIASASREGEAGYETLLTESKAEAFRAQLSRSDASTSTPDIGGRTMLFK
jgi:hypothetical protein